LLGEPVNDLDVATDARPQAVMDLAQKSGFKAIGTGLEFGTVTVVVDNRVYEITTLRVDFETDGRHATVSFTKNWREDAARRDFTMNALYLDSDGTVFDPLGGYDDLVARRVRFIGDPHERIEEDFLRILRFFRFSAQYGRGSIDKQGLAACVSLQKGLASLSAERIRSELLRLLLMPRVVEVVDTMFSHGLLLPLIYHVPHLARLKNWLRLENALERKVVAIDRLGALAMLVNEDADGLARQVRLSNEEKKSLKQWSCTIEINKNTSEKQAHILLYRLVEDYQTQIAINWLFSGDGETDAAWRHLYDLPKRWPLPTFPLKGRDLVDAGMAKGPSIGKTLLKLEQIWIDSDFTLARRQLLESL
jgi:poly(A) polymerase